MKRRPERISTHYWKQPLTPCITDERRQVMSSERASLSSATADPGAIGLSLFGFALFLYGIQFVVYAGSAPGAAASSVATIYAVLVAAIVETLAGVLYVFRGQGYQASILCGFGLWLF